MSELLDMREVARSALNDLPQADRAQLMTELLVEIGGTRGLELLSKTRAAVSLRMQEIIDARYPLYELAEVYGDAAAVRARVIGLDFGRDECSVGFFDLPAARSLAALIRQRRIADRRADGSDQEMGRQGNSSVLAQGGIPKVGDRKADRVLGGSLDKPVQAADVGRYYDF